MKKPLPLFLGTIICANALLSSLNSGSATTAQTHGFQKFFGVSTAHAEEAAAVKYTCPMHQQIISDTPGKCPICGMDLVPIAGTEHQHLMSTPTQAQTGKPVVEMSAENIQKMGVRTEKVSKVNFGQGIRATGIVMPNERTRVDLFSQVEGRVENLRYSAEGDRVTKGEQFYSLISPELTTLQNDYIAARSAGLQDMAVAAARRLKLLGIDEKVIVTLSKKRTAYDSVPFYVPADGVLNKIVIKNGYYLKPGDEVGRIQDLSTVWIEAAVPEQNLPAIQEKQNATITFAETSHNYTAIVDYIYPTIDPQARTGRVRLVVENKDGKLKPAGYAAVEFAASTAERLAVASEAVLRSSTGSHVIVSLGNGQFQSRDVVTGASSDGRTEILSGLAEGDNVVTSAQFLIDSESSLKESLQKLNKGTGHGK